MSPERSGPTPEAGGRRVRPERGQTDELCSVPCCAAPAEARAGCWRFSPELQGWLYEYLTGGLRGAASAPRLFPRGNLEIPKKRSEATALMGRAQGEKIAIKA